MEKLKIDYLGKLIKFVEAKSLKMEEYLKKEDSENFNSIKKTILDVQRKIEKELS